MYAAERTRRPISPADSILFGATIHGRLSTVHPPKRGGWVDIGGQQGGPKWSRRTWRFAHCPYPGMVLAVVDTPQLHCEFPPKCVAAQQGRNLPDAKRSGQCLIEAGHHPKSKGYPCIAVHRCRSECLNGACSGDALSRNVVRESCASQCVW
jgi:hypothetical protein